MSALTDEDETVRASAVHVLGNMQRRQALPLHRLVEALGDADWHVRETAVFALGKQGERIPQEVIKTALYDKDFSVREAARLVLQWHTTDNSVTYGKLWEQANMQDKQEQALSQENAGRKTSASSEVWHDSRTYNGYAANSHIVRETSQEYATQEHASAEPGFAEPVESPTYEYQHEHEASPQWQKVMPRRSSHKGWWTALVATAIVSFLLGVSVTGWFTPHLISGNVFPTKIEVPKADRSVSSFDQLVRDGRYNEAAFKEIAAGLNMNPDAITQQLKMGKSMIDIAASQHIDAQQLHNIELKAFTDMVDYAVKSGRLDPNEGAAWLNTFQKDPSQLDNQAAILFFPDAVPVPAGK
jgi:hypothetical protein